MERKVTVYQATHRVKCKAIPNYLIPIQVGAALTKERIADLDDQSGDQISEKNREYCELTALYWGWKNGDSPIWGLCHYRRKFTFQNQTEIEEILETYDWITAPSYCFRVSLEMEYQKYHQKKEMELLKEVLKEKEDGSYEAACKVLSENRLYPYNMLIAKRKKMEEYCKWLFDILFQVEALAKKRNDFPCQDRYIGFLAERLMTIYIYKKRLFIYEDSLLYEDKNYNRKRKIHSNRNDKIFHLRRRWSKKKMEEKEKIHDFFI